MCDIIWCKKCDTVNYLDPYNFWNFEGKVGCAGCGAVYYVHLINGYMYRGPEEKPGETADILPLYADQPNNGYEKFYPGVPGRTRPYNCLPRDIYLGKADHRKFSIRGYPVRGWAPQPRSTGPTGIHPFIWQIEKHSPDVWQEFMEKKKKGEVRDW